MSGMPVAGILEKTELSRLPTSLIKYLWCSPSLDFKFRCMPSAGGLNDQKYRDFLDFNIIENRIRDFEKRQKTR